MTETIHGETEAQPQILVGLRYAFLATILVLAIESLGAYFSRSLSLTVDAAHNVPDLLAFAASWAVFFFFFSGSSVFYTFGSHRFEVFAGLFNAALVLAVGGIFAYTAVSALWLHMSFAGPVDPTWILVAAVPTLALRSLNLRSLRRVPGRARDLNLNSVLVHLSSDLVITGALLFAGFVLLFDSSAWWADPAAALFIAAVLLWESAPLFRAGFEVLTERTPGNLSLDVITASARSVPNVLEVHDVHVWAVCPTLVCMSAHVRISEMSVRESMTVVALLKETMEKEFGIVHSVFEVEVGTNP